MRCFSVFMIASLVVSTGLAQAPKGPPPAPPETRQFDFWVGEWEVTTPDGKPAGTNKIERIAKDRGLLENWTGAGGGEGKSLNAYNAAKRQWQQFWVGANGAVVELSGGLDAQGNMVLAGESRGPNPGLHRITWTPKADGTVRQLWESSTDEGKTWKVAFDGLYRRK